MARRSPFSASCTSFQITASTTVTVSVRPSRRICISLSAICARTVLEIAAALATAARIAGLAFCELVLRRRLVIATTVTGVALCAHGRLP